MRNTKVCIVVLLFLVSICYQADLAAKNKKLTRIGAEAGSNSTGEIPAYKGDKGMKCPKDFKSGDYLPNPYKGEKMLYRIDKSNVEKYKNRLSAGQIARIKRNKYYINVYPGHRRMTFPNYFYAATDKNKKTCKVDKNNMMRGFNGGIPFTNPKNGVEAIWNVKKPWQADDAIGDEQRRIVSPSGRIKKEQNVTEVITLDKTRLTSKIANPDKAVRKLLSYYTYPADKAGMVFLGINYIDDNRDDVQWLYIPALRRVRRAPTLSRGSQIDGESTMDEFGYIFRGPLNDWNWKLLGKKEMYIPVNNYDMWEVGAPDKEECLPRDINPKNLRYELRRVWVIEGTLKKGLNHPYSKRVIYCDEDDWYATASDNYDKRGNLWRTCEFYSYYDYCQKYRNVVAQLYLNLDSGRYELFGGRPTKDSKTAVLNTGLKQSKFTVQAVKRRGR